MFLNLPLKLKVAEDLMESCIEDHAFGPTNVGKIALKMR